MEASPYIHGLYVEFALMWKSDTGRRSSNVYVVVLLQRTAGPRKPKAKRGKKYFCLCRVCVRVCVCLCVCVCVCVQHQVLHWSVTHTNTLVRNHNRKLEIATVPTKAK